MILIDGSRSLAQDIILPETVSHRALYDAVQFTQLYCSGECNKEQIYRSFDLSVDGEN